MLPSYLRLDSTSDWMFVVAVRIVSRRIKAQIWLLIAIHAIVLLKEILLVTAKSNGNFFIAELLFHSYAISIKQISSSKHQLKTLILRNVYSTIHGFYKIMDWKVLDMDFQYSFAKICRKHSHTFPRPSCRENIFFGYNL